MNKLTSHAELLNPFDDVDLFECPSDFNFGANAPQDTQDSQDAQDPHRTTEKNIRVQSTKLDLISVTPLGEYVRQVLEFAERSTTEKRAAGIWFSPLFDFTRLCKAHPTITNLSSDEAMRKVERVMWSWNDLPFDEDPWEHFFPLADDGNAARLDFMTSWSAVRHIPFQEVLQNALRLSIETPLYPERDRGLLYARFISLAGWLQLLMKDSAIYLPTRKLDSILNCNPATVSRLRKLAVEDGLLQITKSHTFRPNGKGEATEFRFAVERFEDLKGKP